MNRIKKKIINNTGNALCDVCHNPNLLVEHHIRGRNIPNPNHKSNLCYICSNCHFEIHKGKKIIEGWLTTTSGPELIWHFKNEESLTNDDAIVHLF